MKKCCHAHGKAIMVLCLEKEKKQYMMSGVNDVSYQND